jgi:tetratricopeptide (TPR) repeat protein
MVLLGLLVVDCGHGVNGDVAGPAAPTALRSQRRLVYFIAKKVPIATTPGADAVAATLEARLRADVKQDMTELGLEVEKNPRLGYDLGVSLSATVQTVGRLVRARAVLGISSGEGADARVIESIDSAEVIQPVERLAGALAADLVEKLARSVRAAEYADAVYGRRLRPLRDTTGSHTAGRGDQGEGAPPVEAMMLSDRRRPYDRTRHGRPELPLPATDPTTHAAAQSESAKAQSLLTAGDYRAAYAAFEEAYILDRDVEPLFGMAESLFSAGSRQDALIFYRAYLQTAPQGPSSTKAQSKLTDLDPSP